MVVVLLDARLQVNGFSLVSLGVLNQTMFHPREVFRPAIIGSAYAIVIMHNHPSGNPWPSEEDRLITKTVYETSLIIGIKLLDHIIVGDLWCIYSFQESHALTTGLEPVVPKGRSSRRIKIVGFAH